MKAGVKEPFQLTVLREEFGFEAYRIFVGYTCSVVCENSRFKIEIEFEYGDVRVAIWDYPHRKYMHLKDLVGRPLTDEEKTHIGTITETVHRIEPTIAQALRRFLDWEAAHA